MAQDLISQLSRTPGMKVLPPTAVFRFRNWEGHPADIGKMLNATILTGTVNQDGNRIHVQAQLFSKAGGPPLWTRSVSVAAAELYPANDSLVVDVRKALLGLPRGADLLPPVARPTAVVPAYEDYAEGLFQIEQRSAVGISRAIDAFELATRKDPQFAAAHAGLAMAYAFDLQKWPDAERIARHALELDPRSSQARAVLGFIHLFWRRNWERARDEFKSAIDLDPSNATAHHWYALYFAARSFFHEAKTEIEMASALDPYSPAIWADKGEVLILAQHFGEAIAACNQALTLSPDFLNAHICLYRAYRQNGMASLAAAKLSDIRQRLDRQLVAYPEAYSQAEELALQGRVAEAVQKLQTAQLNSEPSVVFALANPVFRSLHRHPGYRALLKKLSLDASFVPYTAGPN
jgi:tetratricopeptide (TPR) repeat protein